MSCLFASLLISSICYLRLCDTRCWHIFSYFCRYVVLELNDLGVWITRMLDRVLLCACCILFYVVYFPPYLAKALFGCSAMMWIVGRWGILKCKPNFHICVLFTPNYIFLFCRRNTMGLAGLTILWKYSPSSGVLILMVN